MFAWDTVLDISVRTVTENIFEEILFSCMKLLASDSHLKIRDLWEIWTVKPKGQSKGGICGSLEKAKKTRASGFKLSMGHLHRQQHLLLLNESHVIFFVWYIIFFVYENAFFILKKTIVEKEPFFLQNIYKYTFCSCLPGCPKNFYPECLN